MPNARPDVAPASGERPSALLRAANALGPRAVALAMVLGLVAAAGGYAVAARRGPAYVAYAATLLDQPAAIAASQDAGEVDKLSRLRLKYVAVLRSDAVVDPVARQLGLSHAAVAAAVMPGADPTSLLLLVGGRASTRPDAVRLANALARQLAAYVTREQTEARIAQPERLTLRIASPARQAVQVLPTRRQKLLSALGSALVAVVLVLGVCDVVRRRDD